MSASGAGGELTDAQRIAWLRLIRTENVGPATFRELVARYGSAETALEMLPELARQGGWRGRVEIPSPQAAERELEHAHAFGARFVAIGEPDYPPLMREMDHPPPLIALKGDASLFARPAVAIVGSRNASLAGMKTARRLAADLGRSGHVVVSGLARGIDAAAHQGSLDTGTVAVLAGSLDEPYPKENRPLFADIVGKGGAAVSEMPFGWELRARDFPRRNRIIAGLALGIVVVEAAKRSGSLISARLAGQFGRLVFAVPGSPLDPRAAGTNALIRDGATLVTSAAEIIEELSPLAGTRQPPASASAFDQADQSPAAPPPGDSDRDRLVGILGPAPVQVDDIIHHTGLSAAEVSMILLELDLAGRLARHPGGQVSLLPGGEAG